jgi:dTDP-4-dehydrorhamnose reductase
MILVTGAGGMLGRDLMKVLGPEVRGADIGDFDITDRESTERLVLTLRPSVLVNVAAYTDVDGAESNRDTAFRVNGDGVRHLAESCRKTGTLLVQISTDYVFDGSKGSPYTEDDAVAPLSVYGDSKLKSEENARLAPEHLVVRTQWLYGHGGKNFVETMLRLAKEKEEVAVVDDQTGSPTSTVDLAIGIKALIDGGLRGTFHAVNGGWCSWCGFTRAIFEEAGETTRVRPMTTAELGRPAPRPLYSVLDCGKLAVDAGVRLPEWREALREYLKGRS